MEAVMQLSNRNRFFAKAERLLTSRKMAMFVALMLVMACAMLVQAHAGAGGASFQTIAKRIEGWAQGSLGLAIVAGGLIFGVASMVFTGRGTVLAIVVGGAVALYYGIPVIEKIFVATGGAQVAKTLIVHGAHAVGMI